MFYGGEKAFSPLFFANLLLKGKKEKSEKVNLALPLGEVSEQSEDGEGE